MIKKIADVEAERENFKEKLKASQTKFNEIDGLIKTNLVKYNLIKTDLEVKLATDKDKIKLLESYIANFNEKIT